MAVSVGSSQLRSSRALATDASRFRIVAWFWVAQRCELVQQTRGFPKTMPGTQLGLKPPKFGCGIVFQNLRERRIRCLERRKAREAGHTHPDPRRFDSHTTEMSIDTSLTTIMHRQIRMAVTACPRDFADFFHLILENSTLDFFQDRFALSEADTKAVIRRIDRTPLNDANLMGPALAPRKLRFNPDPNFHT